MTSPARPQDRQLPAATARGGLAAALLGCILCAGLVPQRSPAADDPPLDEMQQSVVDSLAATPRTTGPELLDAALRAANVDAAAVAEDYFKRVLGLLDEA
ncbi:MAG: hypothetical protein EBR23_11405, partial [Planctomycetia bacterium]|nr:hypothetical protein [Planctomycetia bacterium]